MSISAPLPSPRTHVPRPCPAGTAQGLLPSKAQAARGDSATGKPVRVVSSNNISAWDVGIDDHASLISRVYPNPTSDYIIVEGRKAFDRIEVINYLNQAVLVKEDVGAKSARLSIGSLPRGLYLVKATTKSGQTGVVRVVKY